MMDLEVTDHLRGHSHTPPHTIIMMQEQHLSEWPSQKDVKPQRLSDVLTGKEKLDYSHQIAAYSKSGNGNDITLIAIN
jgi:hypothetical protein